MNLYVFTIAISASAIVSVIFNVLMHMLTTRRKRRKLADAVYYHIQRTIETLAPIIDEKNIAPLKAKINADASYAPYAPWSSMDDLTYDQMIEALEQLKGAEKKKTLMAYFHSHHSLHSIVESLTLNFVRAFPAERKLKIFELFEHFGNETLRYATQAKEQNFFGKWK